MFRVVEISLFICKESSEQADAYISSPIYTMGSEFFGKGAFFILFFLNMVTNPIILSLRGLIKQTSRLCT